MRMRYVVAGGLLLAGMMAVVQAQPGGFGRGGGGGGPTGLVNNKAVQEDLKLTEDQVTKVREWSKDFGKKRFEIMQDKGIDFKDFKSFNTPEGREKMAEVNAFVNKEAYKELGDVLKKEQIDRLKQIDLQQQGVNAFSTEEVASSLKLTDMQKTSVKGILGDFQKESREIRTEAGGGKGGGGKGGGGKGGKGGGGKGGKGGFGGGGFGGFDPATQAKIAKVEKEAMGKITDLLDDSQKKSWKEMTGAEFDRSKLVPTFGKKKD